jgi:hypothetical protein
MLYLTDYELKRVAEWAKNHPGNKRYVCEYCGLYIAGKPRCSQCEEDKDSEDE